MAQGLKAETLFLKDTLNYIIMKLKNEKPILKVFIRTIWEDVSKYLQIPDWRRTCLGTEQILSWNVKHVWNAAELVHGLVAPSPLPGISSRSAIEHVEEFSDKDLGAHIFALEFLNSYIHFDFQKAESMAVQKCI